MRAGASGRARHEGAARTYFFTPSRPSASLASRIESTCLPSLCRAWARSSLASAFFTFGSLWFMVAAASRPCLMSTGHMDAEAVEETSVRASTVAHPSRNRMGLTPLRKGSGVTRRCRRATPKTGVALLLQISSGLVGQLERLGVLAPVVELLRLVELGGDRLHLRVVGLHLRGRLARFLDHLRARARERRTRGEGQRDRDRRDCHELSHVLSPPSEPGWLRSL